MSASKKEKIIRFILSFVVAPIFTLNTLSFVFWLTPWGNNTLQLIGPGDIGLLFMLISNLIPVLALYIFLYFIFFKIVNRFNLKKLHHWVLLAFLMGFLVNLFFWPPSLKGVVWSLSIGPTYGLFFWLAHNIKFPKRSNA